MRFSAWELSGRRLSVAATAVEPAQLRTVWEGGEVWEGVFGAQVWGVGILLETEVGWEAFRCFLFCSLS